MIFGIPWFIAGIGSIVVAVIYSFIWPKELAVNIPFWKFIVLRWFHTVVWVFLALSCFIRYTSLAQKEMYAQGLAYVGLAAYIIFIITFLFSKFG